ncbi:MAG: maltose operon protein [Psychromonas sp.]|jgi:maltose operon protein|uniref:MalM family protein n=1 Tax=Psychromonas sp. TaxID=1884585 RepID=UPI0039E5BC4D
MIIKQTSLLLVTSLIIAGCSNQSMQSPKDQYSNSFIAPAQASEILAEKPSCCDDFSQLQYQEINNNDDLLIPLSSDSQVYTFDSGKSFVQAYKLTSNDTELKLSVNAIIYNTVVAPQVTLLDANFNVTRTISADQFSYTPAKLLDGDMLSAELTIFRPQANNAANETYLLFHTTNQNRAGTTTIIHPAKSFAKAHNTVAPDIADPIIPHSAMGIIELEIDVIGKGGSNERNYTPLAITEKSADISPAITAKTAAAPVLTEQQFNRAIAVAVAAEEIEKALSIVDQAEAAGSKTARKTFINAVNRPTDSAELVFNTAILKAVAAKDINKALTLVEEAEAEGSQTARKTFIEALKK